MVNKKVILFIIILKKKIIAISYNINKNNNN